MNVLRTCISTDIVEELSIIFLPVVKIKMQIQYEWSTIDLYSHWTGIRNQHCIRLTRKCHERVQSEWITEYWLTEKTTAVFLSALEKLDLT